jgi:glycosyltransferase involved in cell wall biosynthesis
VYPVKVFEYLALERAVVASRLHGVSKIIQDEVNGLLVTPGDANALTAALQRLATDHALRQSLEAAARPSAEGYDWSRINQRVVDRVAATLL